MRDVIGMKKDMPGMVVGFRAYLLIAGLIAGLGACSGESTESLLISAKSHIEKNDRKTAIIQLKNALQKNQSLAEARFLLGQILFDMGDHAGAEVELQKALELGFDADQVIPLLAKLQLATGLADKVISQYGVTKLRQPKAQAELQLVLAQAFLALGRRSEAKEAIQTALKFNSSYLDAKILSVRLLATGKDILAANTELNKIFESDPGSSAAWQLKGELQQFGGDKDAALSSYKKSIEFNKFNIESRVQLLWILLGKKDLVSFDQQLKEFGLVFPGYPQNKLFRALLALEKGDTKSAHENSQQLLKQAPDSIQALHLAGAIDAKRGALIQAEASLGKALKFDPNQHKIRVLLTQVYLRAGDYSRAIKTIQPLINVAPESWEANSLMAQAHLIKGDAPKAEYYFSAAAKINPNDSVSRTALALAQVKKGQVDEGIHELMSISAVDAGATADLALISAYIKKGSYEGAIRAIDVLQKKQPSQPMVGFLRGQVELQRGRADLARPAFESALKVDPNFFAATASLASMDFSEGKRNVAEGRFKALIDQDPTNVKASMALLELRIKAGDSSGSLLELASKTVKAMPSEPDPRLVLIGIHIDRKDLKLAMSAAQEAVSMIPDSAELLELLARIQYETGEVNQAIATYNKIVSLHPNSPQAYLRIAEIHHAKKNQDAEFQNLKKALSIKADYLPAQRALMAFEFSAGRASEAMTIARSIQAQRDAESIGFALEGDIEFQKKNWGAAVNSYRTGLAKKPSTELAIKLHTALFAQGKSLDAGNFEQQWLKNNDKDTKFLGYLGDLALAKSDFQLAKNKYKLILNIEPNNAAILNNLAWIFYKTKEPGALDYALKATALAPAESAYLDTLASAYAANGQFGKAVEVQKRAVAAKPSNSEYRLHLAELSIQAGDMVLAKENLQQLERLGDSFSRQAEVKVLLGKM
jgi:putative PEP-CTERM system TPR-repeat lipoprotein